MSNQLKTKATTLAEILASNRLMKEATQQISHKGLLDQDNLGREQTNEIHENIDGVNADTPAARNMSHDSVQDVPGAQDLNRSAEDALASAGTTVDTMHVDGTPAGTPADQAKKASYYRQQLSGIISEMNKRASINQLTGQVNMNEHDFRTGTEVFQKWASLTPNSTEYDLAEAHDELIKLASTNPVFNICRERIMMEKMAEDIEALADAEGISPEEAAGELDAAAEADPAMMEDLEDEATGEAMAELADAEAETDELMGGIEELAANASANLGIEVTPDDIMSAAEETQAMADELGVPPEALIAEAMEEMQGGFDEDITPEDEANAEMILEEAAQNGISPEEVLQMAAEELEGGVAEDDMDEMPVDAPVEKAASLQKRAGTMRAAYVQSLRRRLV